MVVNKLVEKIMFNRAKVYTRPSTHSLATSSTNICTNLNANPSVGTGTNRPTSMSFEFNIMKKEKRPLSWCLGLVCTSFK